MDAGKCFADVISDPQALNDFLSSSQALANQQDLSLGIQSNSNPISLSQMQMIGSSHAGIMFSNSQLKQAQNLTFGNSNSTQPSSNSSNTLPNTLQNRQTPSQQQNKGIPIANYGQSPLLHQQNYNAVNSQSLSATSTTQTILPSNNFQNHQINSYTNANGQKVKGNKIYTPKGASKQTKSVPNILSKGSGTSGSNSPAGQTILLPSNVNGQYILVNSSGQQSQPITVQQNLSQLAHQQQLQMQPQDQQGQQLLVLPANIQQLVNNQAGTNSIVSQNMSPSNQLKSLQQQQPKLAPLRVRQKPTKAKVTAPATAVQVSQPQVPQNLSSVQSSQFISQTGSTLPAGNQLQPGQQISGNSVNSRLLSFQTQNYSQDKTGDELKIVRPVAQPRGMVTKPLSANSSTTTGSLGNANLSNIGATNTSKLSHFPMPQNQIQNLQSMVTQHVTDNIRQTPAVSSASNLAMSIANNVAIDVNQVAKAMQGGASQNVALQQLFRLSQAASQPGAEAAVQGSFSPQQLLQSSVQTPNSMTSNSPSSYQGGNIHTVNMNIQASIAATTSQNISSESFLNMQTDKGMTQQQLIKQIWSQQQQQQQKQQQQLQQLQQQQQQQQQQKLQHLPQRQPQQQQNVDQSSDVTRANIIGQNVQNIIMRQNASKQGNPKQGRSSPQLLAKTTSSNPADGSNPMHLFIPKQLPTSQLLELQQKLLAGKIMQKMQAVQPKPTPSSIVTTGTVATSNVQAVALKQVPLATSQHGTNQLVMPIVTQGMQFFLQTNVSKQTGSNSASPQQIIVASGNNTTQRINLPIVGASSANTIASNIIKQVQAQQQKANTLQGITVQNATTPNIIVKPLDAAGVKGGLTEQQKLLQTKKLQQLLLQLTPAQRNLLVKKQQQYVSKGQSVPLMKLILEVKQENGTVKQEGKPIKRPAADEVKVEETIESKVSKRLKHCLQADQARVTDPNYKIPFQSLEDALSRLLPYHIQNEEIPPEIEWHKAEALFSIVSKQLITRKEKLFDKYHTLMLDESQRQISSSEMVMLERIFLADEKARFAKEKEDFKLGKLKIFQQSTTNDEVEENDETSEKDIESVRLDEDNELTSKTNEEEPIVVDSFDWNETRVSDNGSVEEEDAEEAEDYGEEEEEEEVEEETNIEEDEERQSVNEYEEGVDMIEYNDDEDVEVDDKDDENEDNEDEVVDDMEDDDYEDEETNDEDYIRSLGINDISNQYTNHDFDGLEDLEDLARTTEHNMSEELSQATFNLMADLENDTSNDYYE